MKEPDGRLLGCQGADDGGWARKVPPPSSEEWRQRDDSQGTCRSKTETGFGKKTRRMGCPETPALPEATMLPLPKGLSPPCQYILGLS